MKRINIFASGAALLLASQVAVGGYSFERSVGEVQVLPDRVRIYVATTYGTCGPNEGWWGWETGNMRHKDWLALVLLAKATNKNVVVYDDEGSCNGPGGDIVGLERVYMK